jgi:hypothetical protein
MPYMPPANFKNRQQQNITIACGAYVCLMLLVNSLVESPRKYYTGNYIFVENIFIVTCTGVRMRKIMDSRSDDWIYWHFGNKFS